MSKVEFTPKQSKLWHLLDDPKYRRYLIDGGARSGKTYLILAWLFKEMDVHPGIRIAVLRQHRNHARTTLYDGTIKQLIGDSNRFKFKDTTMEIYHANGSVMRVDGLDDAERVDKILGDEFGHIFINEASQVSYKPVQVAISRLSQNIDGLGKRNLIMDCNPKSTMHWLYQLAIEHRNPETREPITDTDIWARMNFSPLDNPYLPEDTIKSLENLSGIERKRLYEGVWASTEGLVYKGFNIDKHVIERDITNNEGYIIGVDCGTNDPMIFAVFTMIKNQYDKIGLHMVELFYQSGKDMSNSLGDVAEKWRELNPFFVVDPSASPAIVELRARNFRVEPAVNKIKEGITVMNDLINSDRFTVSPNCSEKFIEEIMQYELNPKTEVPYGNTPDHILDASRYASMAFLGDKYVDSSNFYIF